jgi:predicted nucleic acid-binding protein
VSYLLDTNVVSELRKGDRADRNVSAWYRSASGAEKFLSVLTIGEIRRGIEGIRRRDEASARALDVWLARLLAGYAARVLPVHEPIAEEWGRLNVPDPLPVIDGLLAATAIVHGLTLVTRNVDDVKRTRVPCLNPFETPEK